MENINNEIKLDKKNKKKREKDNESNFKSKRNFLKRWFAPMKDKGPRKDNKFFVFIQQLGGTFMLPIAFLAVAGLLLGIGSSFGSEDLIKKAPFFGYNGIRHFFAFLNVTGSFFFNILPLAFCMAIPIGLCSDNKGTAALSALISYFAVLAVVAWFIQELPKNVTDFLVPDQSVKAPEGKNAVDKGVLTSVYGIRTMNISIIGSILIGLSVWKLNERFQYQKLPSGIAFFSGKRFVLVICLFIFCFAGLIVTFVWPLIYQGLMYTGKGLKHMGNFGPGIFIFISRMLCPTGLHHMINTLFNFTAVGGTYDVAGVEVSGNFYAMEQSISKGVALNPENTKWLTGAYILPILFGLPAAGIAMYLTANRENKKLVKGVVISGIIATAIGGITETIEFLFLFVAPLLYVFHAFMIAVGYVVFAYAKATIGIGGDLISFIVFDPIQALTSSDNKWWMAFACGPIVSAIYFTVFYFSIKKFDLKTIGREVSEGDSKINMILDTGAKTADKIDKKMLSKDEKKKLKQQGPEYTRGKAILELLGGWENIKKLENCFSRLRVTLKTGRTITDVQVKQLGCVGLKTISEVSYQIVVGIQVEEVKQAMIRMK